MSDEKLSPTEEVQTQTTNSFDEPAHLVPHDFDPTKWYNKKYVSFLPAYSSSIVQILMVSFVCFLCPGMFNALSGIGGAGLSDASLADKANIALNSTFATLGFFSGTICNLFGLRYTLAFGGTGYALYVASFLCYVHTANAGFCIFAGAFLGLTAACLWGAQGTILMSYPTEATKGRYFFMFWSIFNIGAVIGSCIPLAENMHGTASTVTDGTYVAFLVLTLLGACLACFLLPVSRVVRVDGTRVISQKNPTLRSELTELVLQMKREPFILLLFPMFFASNWFYTYEQSDFNTTWFNVRTRSLNSLLFWFMQMVGALIIGFLVDLKFFSRKSRAFIGWGFAFFCTNIIWGLGYMFVRNHDLDDAGATKIIDFKDSAYIGPMFLYMFYGFYDAVWQCFTYWLMGALTNSSRKAAIYAGYYKGLQSAGATVAWRLDSLGYSHKTLWASSWGLLAGSLVIALPVLYYRVKETTAIEEDLKNTDETFEDIMPIASKVSHSVEL